MKHILKILVRCQEFFFENTFEVSWSSSSVIQPYLPALFPTTLPHFRSTAPVLEYRNHVQEKGIFLRYLRCDQTWLPGSIFPAHTYGGSGPDNFISFPLKSIQIQTQLYSQFPPDDDNKFPPKAVPVKITA